MIKVLIRHIRLTEWIFSQIQDTLNLEADHMSVYLKDRVADSLVVGEA